ncbi:MAG: aspartyl protease family protein [Sphingomicrobium sp.]
MIRILAVFGALVLLPVSSLASTPPATPVIVTLKFEDGRVYVPARAQGGALAWFILDTGATSTILDNAYARRLKLRALSSQRVMGAGAGSSTQSNTTPVTLSIGGVRMHVTEPLIADLKSLLGPTSGRNPAGIIGSKFFLEHTVELDFQQRILRVWPRGADVSSAYAETVPLTFVEDTPLALATLTLPSDETINEKVLVDLGAKSTLLIPEPFIEKHHLHAAFGRSATLPLGAGVGGNTYYTFVRTKQLALGGRRSLALNQPVIGLSAKGSLKSDWHEGLLGAEYLARFRVAFDYSRARLMLTPVLHQPATVDRSGIFLVWSDAAGRSRYFVRDLLAGGPGEQAGIRTGDELLSIDGRTVGRLSLDQVRSILRSPTPTTSLRLVRGGRTYTASITLRDLV